MDGNSSPSERKRKRTKSIASAQDTTETPSLPPSEASPKKKKQTKTPADSAADPPKFKEYQTPSPRKPETSCKPSTPSRSKRQRKSSSTKTPPAPSLETPGYPTRSVKHWGSTPDKANLLVKHGRKVKTLMPLVWSTSQDVRALGREPTCAEFGALMGKHAEILVRFCVSCRLIC